MKCLPRNVIKLKSLKGKIVDPFKKIKFSKDSTLIMSKWTLQII